MELEEDQRNKWSEVLDLKYMSSEESASENILKVKSLPWLSTRASEFKHKLDQGRQPLINSQSKRHAKRKITGESSDRKKPDGSSWIFKKQKQ